MRSDDVINRKKKRIMLIKRTTLLILIAAIIMNILTISYIDEGIEKLQVERSNIKVTWLGAFGSAFGGHDERRDISDEIEGMEDLKGMIIIVTLLLLLIMIMLWSTIWKKLEVLPWVSFGIAIYSFFMILLVLLFFSADLPTSRIPTSKISTGLFVEMIILTLVMVLCMIGSIYGFVGFVGKQGHEKHVAIIMDQ